MTTTEFFSRNWSADPYAVEMSKRHATMDELWRHCEPGMVFWLATQPGVVDDATLDRMGREVLRIDMPGMQAIDTIVRLGPSVFMPFARAAGHWLRANATPNWEGA
jgi:hypothetical protein